MVKNIFFEVKDKGRKMSIPNTNETQIQNNIIDLLKNMGYTYLSPEEMTKHRSSTGQVVLKDILLNQLQKLNGFGYKGTEYPFFTKCTKIKEHIA